MRKFFIFSLPRSGSAWLSVFLGGAGVYCYHEPFADGDWLFLDERISGRGDKCVGAIDTSGYLRGDLLLDGYAQFVLLREMSAVQRSLRLRGWITHNLQLERDKLIARASSAFPIHYERLHDVDYLERIWDMITEGMPFDRERAEYLTEMNIQRTFASVAKRVAL